MRFCLDERWYVVKEIIESWREPQYVFFKVRADDGSVYILRHETSTPDGEWGLVAFRNSVRYAGPVSLIPQLSAPLHIGRRSAAACRSESYCASRR